MGSSKFMHENSFLLEDRGTAFLFVLVAFISTVYFLRRRKGQRLPPGPLGLPVLGYYPYLDKFPAKTLKQLAGKYGSVFSFYLGPQLVVVLNDWTVAKETLQQDPTLDRPPTVFAGIPYRFGFAGVNGLEWQQTRRLSTRIIKDTGLNRVGWEDLIKEEVEDLVKQIAREEGNAMDVRSMFEDAFANNIMTLLLGERLYPGHPLTKMIAKSVDAILQNSTALSMRNFSPTLCNILHWLGIEKQFLKLDMVRDLGKFVSDTVDERLRNSAIEFEDSFIGRYQKEIQSLKKSNKNTYITVDTLKGNTIAMLAGGGETTRTNLIWILIAMADHPDIQGKVQEELDSVIGREGSIKWEDRHKVPYTYATLLESLRWRTIAPIPAPRMASADMQVQGYHIPKSTYIYVNMWAIHNDPKYWKNPEEFNPVRFLSDDAKKVNTSPESFAPFSYEIPYCSYSN